jgi:hypothetical protein
MKEIIQRKFHSLERIETYQHPPKPQKFDYVDKIKKNRKKREQRRAEVKSRRLL